MTGPLAEARGALVDGERIAVDGLTIRGPGDAPWIRLDARDYRPRAAGVRPTQIVLHTTWGVHPQRIVPGPGRPGHARDVLVYWADHPQGRLEYAGAHVVVGEDGVVHAPVDLATIAAHHATVANPWSVGIEICQLRDGTIHEPALDATVRLVVALCTGAGARRADGSPWPGPGLGIPLQHPGRVYDGAPIWRLTDGGRSYRGIYGHRDNTRQRGRGDPGDEVWRRLEAAGSEPLDLARYEDLERWRRRQAALVRFGERIAVDGIAGPATLAAMRRRGFSSGRELDAAS